MNIRKSKIDDIEKIDEIYSQAKRVMKNSGIDQWQGGTPNSETAREDIENDISYVVEDNGEIIATAALFVGKDETYDVIREGRWLENCDRYGVIHRIAVSPKSKNRGVASFIMNYCNELCKKEGVNTIRCDTHIDNKIMQATLLKNKFVYCGKITILDGTERIAFEKMKSAD